MKLRIAAVSLLLALAGLVPQQPAAAATSADADAAMTAFTNAFWDPAKKYFYVNSDHQIHSEHAYGPESGKYTDFWWEAQLWELVMDTYQRTGSSTYRQMIDDVYTGFLAYYPTFSNDFNDDLAWWALASIRAYEITGTSTYLTTARTLLDSIWAYQDSTYGGGIWWQRGTQNQKNVATNATAATAAARIYSATGDSTYLSRAQSLFSWVKSTLQSSGHVYDHVEGSGSGTVVKWDFSYNFGSYIGAAAALNTATGTSAYLTDATDAATWATTYLTNGGTPIYEGTNDGGGFKTVLIRNLARLVTGYGQSQYLPYLQRNATQGWNHRRTSDNLVGPDWSAPTGSGYIQSLTAAAAASALQVTTPDGNTGPQPENGLYQAENAVATQVGAESTNSGFTGRGYLAGWSTATQSVTFNVNVPSAGPHELRLRYAAAAGDAGRKVVVNGSVVAANQSFPGTAGWSTWNTATLNGVTLNQGYNTISIAIDTSAGNGNYLNLDSLQISRQLQAETGTLHSVGTESSNGGYTGSGYVAGWNANGQWVDLTANVSRAGTYDLTFRYAAAAGNASRYIYVNSASATNNLSFPGTGNWATWNTVTLTNVQLQAGANTISVIFDSSKGSTNWLNLDELTLRYAPSA
ncbi:glycoside hydrolase family 76 protein [Nonomuraea guangzhouensis]|uniref:Glycoside hydrolase family 76 protein n=1 Tax=Nonomuraea guangzhouensis TaxID=1291555 RepID=A0ABW4GNG1_9ACTN|nr:glycoside hydrolase family 76 protein [Nonomuraea guangzhouensis]